MCFIPDCGALRNNLALPRSFYSLVLSCLYELDALRERDKSTDVCPPLIPQAKGASEQQGTEDRRGLQREARELLLLGLGPIWTLFIDRLGLCDFLAQRISTPF